MRNWLYYTWLSGDHTAEQHIHSLDKIMWLMGDEPPVRASGVGGRIQRTGKKWGNVYDHFSTVFEFKNGVHAHARCRQQKGCFNSVDEYVTGTKGHAKIIANTITQDGGEQWKFSGKEAEHVRCRTSRILCQHPQRQTN